MHVCVYMCVKVHSPIYMNKEAGDQHLRFSSIILHLTYYWDKVSHWIWKIIGWATLASQWAPWPVCSPPVLGLHASKATLGFYLLHRFWGSKFRSSHLHSKHFTHSATAPLLQSFIFCSLYFSLRSAFLNYFRWKSNQSHESKKKRNAFWWLSVQSCNHLLHGSSFCHWLMYPKDLPHYLPA